MRGRIVVGSLVLIRRVSGGSFICRLGGSCGRWGRFIRAHVRGGMWRWRLRLRMRGMMSLFIRGSVGLRKQKPSGFARLDSPFGSAQGKLGELSLHGPILIRGE